ncbi:MAG: T9SS type A sorting domain-containing protein [Chitinophagales bacterium]|nr:T9SS type A sorting domain-containing protein [Chitinophagales bacterium]
MDLVKNFRKYALVLLISLIAGPIFLTGQNAVVLPTDGSSSFELSPQGNLHFQRQLYLIPKSEIQASDLNNGALINSLGFTIGHAQDKRTKGGLQIYLQNTNDVIARTDSAWTYVPVTANMHKLTALNQGDFEWEVATICSGDTSAFSSASFSTDLSDCNAPQNLTTSNITTNSATLNWDLPASPGFQSFIVEYTKLSPVSWTMQSTTDTTLTISGLDSSTIYQWRVRTNCSGETTFNVGASFTTSSPDDCNEVNGPIVDSIGSNAFILKWDADTTAIRYDVQYRIKGTSNWFEIISTSNKITIADQVFMGDTFVNIHPGTIYEWRVRVVCDFDITTFKTSVGSYVDGTEFTTNGPLRCRRPQDLKVENISTNSAHLSWLSQPQATMYLLRFRLKNSITWTNAISGMSKVHQNAARVPKQIGPWDIPFSGDTIFKDSFSVSLSLVVDGSKTTFPSIQTDSCIVVSDTLLTFDISGNTETPTERYAIKLNPVITPISINPDSVRVEVYGTIDNNAILLGTFYTDSAFVSGDDLFLYKGPNNASLVLDKTVSLLLDIDKVNNPVIDSLISVDLFTYTGAGLYVAFEYTNRKNSISTFNRVLSTERNPSSIKSKSGLDSIVAVICLKTQANTGDTDHRTRLTSIQERPETRLGSSSLTDIAEVVNLYTLGCNAIPYGNPASVIAVIGNNSGVNQNFTINFSVIGTESNSIKFNTSFPLNVAANTQVSVPTTYSPSIMESDSLSVSINSVAGENILYNNSVSYIQNVNPYFLGYADESENISSAGLDTTSGLILAKYTVNGCALLSAVDIFIDPSAAKQEIYGVVLDAGGTIIDTSRHYVLDSTETNAYRTFYFPSTPSFNGQDFYVGLAQTENSVNGYKPVGVQWETEYIRSGAYFRSEIDGSNITDVRTPGRLMIKAELTPLGLIPEINGSLTLCIGGTNVLSVGGKTQQFANSVIGVSSEFSDFKFSSLQALGAPDVFPDHNSNNPNQWIGTTPDDQREYIVLGFADHSKINYVNIYQTLNPGAIDTVVLIDSLNNKTVVFARKLFSKEIQFQDLKARIQRVTFPKTSTGISKVRIALASDSIKGSNSIDAVAIGVRDPSATFASYLWSPGGETSSSISVNAVGEYSVQISSANGCVSNSVAEVSAFASIIPEILYDSTHALTFCGDDSIVLTSSLSSGITWSTGDTTTSIVVSTSGEYFVLYDAGNGCGAVSSDTITIQVDSLPTPTMTGLFAICPGGFANLTTTPIYPIYKWSTGSTNQSISIAVPGTYTVTVTDNNGCTGSASGITFNGLPPMPVISGPTAICPASNETLSVQSTFSNYIWSTGETTASINISSGSIYTVTVTDVNGCTAAKSLNVVQLVPPQPVISGALSFCGGNSTVLDAGIGFSNYIWSNGATTQTITVDSAGVYAVTVTDAFGCIGDTSVTVSQFGSLPQTPGPISGLVHGVCNTSGVVYSILPVINTTLYVWTVPAGATIVSGQGSTSIIVDYNNIDSGDIVVAASNACGQSPSANPRVLKVYGGPAQPGSIMGQANGLCSNMGIKYWINPVSNSSSYTWSVPSNVTIISGQGSTMITVNLNMLSGQTGTICVTANNICGNSVSSCLDVLMLISDPILPIAMCKNTSVTLSAQGSASITATDINNGSSDNCGISSIALSKSTFGCVDIGNKTVTLTVTDNFANVATCTATISVSDPTLNCPCFTPAGLVTDNLGLNSARLNWTPTPNAQAYRLYGERLGYPPIDFTIGGGNTALYNASKLNLKTFYYWSIQAICDAGGGSTRTSSIAQPDTFRTAACTNPKNTQTILSVVNPKQATLSWDPTPFAVGYRLIGQKAGGTQQSIDINGNSNTSFFTNTLETNTSYMWIVLSGCVSSGSVVFSNSATAIINSFTTGNVVSQKRTFDDPDDELLLWPNPTEAMVNVKIEGIAKDVGSTIKIINIAGEEVMILDYVSPVNGFANEIDVRNLAAGIYQVIAIDGERILKKKLVISR